MAQFNYFMQKKYPELSLVGFDELYDTAYIHVINSRNAVSISSFPPPGSLADNLFTVHITPDRTINNLKLYFLLKRFGLLNKYFVYYSNLNQYYSSDMILQD